MELLKGVSNHFVPGTQDKVDPETKSVQVLSPAQLSGAPFLPWTQTLGWPFRKGNSRTFCGKRVMHEVMRVGSWAPIPSPTPGTSCRFTYIHCQRFLGIARRDQRQAGAPIQLPASTEWPQRAARARRV